MTATPRPRLFNLAWPLFMEMLLGIGIGVIGTALAARLSDSAGGAFALAHHVYGTLFILFRIVGAGVSVVVTQNLGGGRRDRADGVARAALGASTWLGGIAAVMALLGAAPLLGLLNAPSEVMPLAAPFLQWLAPAMLLDAWNASMASVMRAHLRTRDTLHVIIAMHMLHLCLAFPLMLGWGPLPAMGLTGFAVALLASRVLGLALHLLLWRARLGLHLTRGDWWRLPREELGAILHIGLPGAAENIAYRLAYMVSIAAAARLGAGPLATHSYVLQLMYGALLFGVATGFAVEIVVGHQIGAGHLHDAHRLVRRTLARSLLISVAATACAALAAPWMLRLFTNDPEIIRTGTWLMWLTVIMEPGRTFNLVVINALRATGDARYPVMAGAASMALVLALGSWTLAVPLGLGLTGLWIAYAADEWIRGLLMWRRWARQDWVPYARATHSRLRRGRPEKPLAEA
jgi:putative MATE family efflux protein